MTVRICMLLTVLVAAEVWAEPTPVPEPTTAYQEQTRQAVREVLATREFAQLKESRENPLAKIIRWLSSVFSAIPKFFASLPGWLWWVLLGWMIITLVAVLVHLLWTLIRTLGLGSGRGGARSSQTGLSGDGLLGVADLTFEQVHAEAMRLMQSGDWAAAIRHLYVAALLWLDHHGRVAFRPSKTNHDYLTELAPHPRVRKQFAGLTRVFEALAYGRQAADERACTWTAQTVEELCHETAETTTR